MLRNPRRFLIAVVIAAAVFTAVWALGPAVTRYLQAAQKAAAGTKRPATRPRAVSSAVNQSHRNVGRAYYEQGKYTEAIGEFQKVIASGQALATDHFNLGLALMQANQLDQALGELTTAKQMDPKLVAADYNLGILYKRELHYPEAAAALKRVTEADADDPAAWFNLGTTYFSERKFPEALVAYQHVIKMGFGQGQNFYVAALFRAFTTEVRLGHQPEAQQYLKTHERLRDRVPSISLQNQALESGKYGAILVPPSPPVTVARAPEKVTLADITASLSVELPAGLTHVRFDPRREIRASEYSLDYARKEIVPMFGPSLALGDYDGDGKVDIFFTNPSGANRLFHNNGDGTFTDVTAKAGLGTSGDGLGAVFADYNNSGHPSLFIAGLGGVRVFKNRGDGTFEDATEKAGFHTEAGELDTRVVSFDADSDGFLDLVVTAYTNLNNPPKKDSFVFPNDFAGARSHFYRNNGDGTFTDATEASGLAAAEGRMRGTVFADFSGSDFPDLVFLRDDGPPLYFVNQGEDKFVNRTKEAGAAFVESPAFAAQVADFDHDGDFDLVLWRSDGPQVLLNRGRGHFVAARGVPPVAPPASPFAFHGLTTDLNGDSFADLIALDAQGKWHFLENRAGHFHEAPMAVPPAGASPEDAPLAQLDATWLREPGRLDLVGLTLGGKFLALETQGPPGHWVEVKLKGFKSNLDAVGTVVEFKAGNFYKKVLATSPTVGTYTGNLSKLDVVRVTWPNQIVQNSINVATNKPLSVNESERLASSCPQLYYWNGERYAFWTDVLGVAPLGELAPDGTRLRPNPEEFVRLPELHEHDGAYTFQITDELREVDYVDQLRLVAVDHQPQEQVYANEIYASSPEKPALYAVTERHAPVSAVDDHGHNVLPLVLKSDDEYPADFKQDRILGLAETHALALDLGNFPNSQPVSLWLKGWVFWTDSNGSHALMNNRQLAMVSPYLQVRDAAGNWVTAIPDMGLPSGTHRTMRVDLTGKFPTSDHHVRIVTNLCVYWDQIFVATKEERVAPTEELPLVSADLHYRGFSEPASDPRHRRPDYFEYTKLMPQAPWDPMTGNYTRYGDVTPLVTQPDDHLVVMATGDEMTVRFDARSLPRLKPGWTRDFFLYAAGYAKDGEPNTSFATTVTPLPYRAMENYPPATPHARDADYERYLREYQTRPRYRLIPPLAPVVR